jgi:MFS superfamily sulfate permease-like transporter
VNNDIGAKSPLSVFVTGWFVMLTMLVITPVFKYLPRSAVGESA